MSPREELGLRAFAFLLGVGALVIAALIVVGKMPVIVNGVATDSIFMRVMFVFLGGGMGLAFITHSVLGDGGLPKVVPPHEPGVGLLRRIRSRVRATAVRILSVLENVGLGALVIGMAAFMATFIVGVVFQIGRWIWHLVF
ncbi:hypothetical protein [Allorhizocola rhizosphaerae]|uniref:hypothetical protein n=1 Tax=Allorhizocola rhizosphaerae TaxID=1872709 RepID=UPI000E3C7F79|nr:hypothetical protein [Allorhizocola rhizosphaerae]